QGAPRQRVLWHVGRRRDLVMRHRISPHHFTCASDFRALDHNPPSNDSASKAVSPCTTFGMSVSLYRILGKSSSKFNNSDRRTGISRRQSGEASWLHLLTHSGFPCFPTYRGRLAMSLSLPASREDLVDRALPQEQTGCPSSFEKHGSL